MRDFAPQLSQPLSAILNALIKGHVPPIWKDTEVIPVSKVPKNLAPSKPIYDQFIFFLSPL